jgi:hypothetical protein
MANTCLKCQCRDCASIHEGLCEHPCKWTQMCCMAPVTKCNDYVKDNLFKGKPDG